MRNVLGAKFVLISIILGLVLAACSGQGISSSEDARAQQAKDVKALEGLYAGVQGVWEGTVSNSRIGLAPFSAKLTIYTYFIQDGVNPDGSPRLRPTLRGKFQPNDFITETDVMILVGDYDRSGHIVMTAQASSEAASEKLKILSLRGTIGSGGMSIEVTRQGGVWGYFDATRISVDASAPLGGELLDNRERFMRIYGPLEGRYVGTMKSVNGNDYRVEIAMVIVEVGTGYPTLMAQYKRLDAPSGALEWNLVVTYNSQTNDIYMRESTATGGSSLPGAMILSVTGTLEARSGKKALVVSVRNRSAVLGQLEAVRN